LIGCASFFGALIVLVIILAVARSGGNSGSSNNTSSQNAAPAPAPTVATTPQPTAAPTTTAPPGPRFFQAGQGIQTTTKFTVPAEWILKWHYDCSSFGDSGNFIVNVKNGDGSDDFQATGVNELGPGGDGIQNFHADGGSKYFDVNSECSWALNVPG
jgi:hypothetical protein